jgi:hypothetical protein
MSETIRGKKLGREEKRRKGMGNRGKGGKSRGGSRLLLIESDSIMFEKNFPSIG